jgi:16S rRNA (cytosine1402-N4)-methyltransferase
MSDHASPSPSAPAPGHVPVLLDECVEALAVRSDGRYVDATFGRGGHSRAILSRLGPEGRLLALDRDPEAIAVARAIDDPRFIPVHAAFADIGAVLATQGWAGIDGALLDLGVSSPQLDTPARGFSFRTDAPLDMRMDTTQGITAAQWIADADESELKEVIRNHGEERFAGAIAKQIVAARRERRIETSGQLAAIVGAAVRTREPGQNPATRTFQAVRIHINQELTQLSLALQQLRDRLVPGGRLAVIAFHSLEDRIVKHFLREAAQPQAGLPRMPLRADQLPQPVMRLIGGARRPGATELSRNPRARSAVLRVAEKLPSPEAPCV